MAAQGQAAGGEAGQQQNGSAQGGDQNALQQGLAALTPEQFNQALDERISPLQQQFGDFMQQFQQQQEPAQQDEPAFNVDELEASFGLDRQGAEQLAGVLQEHTNSQVQAALEQFQQQHLAPLQQQVQQQQWEMDASQLASEIPDLQNPEMAQQVMDAANQIAENIGQPNLATHPQFVRVLAYGMIGMQYAQQQQQTAESAPQAAHMEGGGGAAPQSAQQNPDDAVLQRLGYGDGQRKFGAGAHRGVLAP